MRVNTLFAFCLALVGVLFFPNTHLTFFAPYLVLVFYQQTRFATLWRAIGCGLILDLLSSPSHFGFHALNYCFISWILYGQNRNFFEDKPFTLPIMTFLFSFLATLASAILLVFFDNPIIISFKWIITDLLCMPLIDSFYAFLLYLPFQITYQLRRIIRAKWRER